MYAEEVLTGSNSLGPFVWVNNVFWFVLVTGRALWTKRMALLQELNGQDGLRALSFFAGTSACILKGTG